MVSARIHSYDVLVMFAISSMLVDHIGFFFYPDIEIFRVIGRLAAPLFLFLYGYGHNHIKPSFALLALILTLFKGQYPLDILATFFILSVSYKYLFSYLTDYESFFFSILIFFVVEISISPYMSYISVAFLYFMAGKSLYNNKLIYSMTYLILAISFQFALYLIAFNNTLVLALILNLLLLLCIYFYRDIYTTKQSASKNLYVSKISKYSLHIYIAHIIVFAAIQHFLQLHNI